MDAVFPSSYASEDITCTDRLKFTALATISPLTALISTVFNTVYGIFKLVSFMNFWETRKENSYNFTARLLDTGKDILRVALSPIFYLGQVLSAIVSIFSPTNGWALYAGCLAVYVNPPRKEPTRTELLLFVPVMSHYLLELVVFTNERLSPLLNDQTNCTYQLFTKFGVDLNL